MQVSLSVVALWDVNIFDAPLSVCVCGTLCVSLTMLSSIGYRLYADIWRTGAGEGGSQPFSFVFPLFF